MASLDEFRRMLIEGLAQPSRTLQSYLTPVAAATQEHVVPDYLKSYIPPEIPPGMEYGKIGPGPMSAFEQIFGLGMEFLGPPGAKTAPMMAMAAMGAKKGTDPVLVSATKKLLNMLESAPKSTQLQAYKGMPEAQAKIDDAEFAALLRELSAPPPPKSVAATPEPIGGMTVDLALKNLQDALMASEHGYDIEKKLATKNVTLPSLWADTPQWSAQDIKEAAAATPRAELPLWLSVPWHAREAGYTVPAAHGTVAKEPFKRFLLGGGGEIGPHFGTPKTAMERLKSITHVRDEPRIYPVVLQIQNPLDVKDFGTSLGTAEMYENLMRHAKTGRFRLADVEALKGRDVGEYRDFIRKHGYDALRYINMIEDPGAISYSMLRADPRNPRYAAGIRVPWAKFKDLESSDIGAALAALGLTGAGAAISLKAKPEESRLEQ